MATLHMDVEQVQAAQQKMVSEREALLNELGTLTNQINSIIGSAWQGNSATEFQQAYEQLRNQLNQQLTTLGELATALQTEITQWQEVAARMG
jgi:WXG100 family type VII secretion target